MLDARKAIWLCINPVRGTLYAVVVAKGTLRLTVREVVRVVFQCIPILRPIAGVDLIVLDLLVDDLDIGVARILHSTWPVFALSSSHKPYRMVPNKAYMG